MPYLFSELQILLYPRHHHLRNQILVVAEVLENEVVLDGNHPLAGMALRFWVQVEDIRAATDEEIENRHPEGGEAFTFGMPDDSDDGDDEFTGDISNPGSSSPTLH